MRVLTTLILCAFAALMTHAVYGDDSTQLRVMSEAYIHNRASFTRFYCRFEYKELLQLPAADIPGKKVDVLKRLQNGQWLVDGSNVYYELMCSEEDTQATEEAVRAAIANPTVDFNGRNKVEITVPCASTQYLRSADFSLRYDPTIQGANLFATGDIDAAGIRVTPFNPDILGADEASNPARYITEGLSGRFSIKYRGVESIDGVELAVIAAYDDRYVFGFDPRKNYCLAYSSAAAKDGTLHYKMNVLEHKEFPDNRWFPMRLIKTFDPDGAGPTQICELTVKHLTVDVAIPDERFAVTIPAETQVAVIDRPQWTFVSRQQKVRLKDLEQLNQRCIETGKKYEDKKSKKSAPQSSTNQHITPVVVYYLGFFAAVAAAVLLVRRR